MNVQELIDYLKHYPQDYQILVEIHEPDNEIRSTNGTKYFFLEKKFLWPIPSKNNK